MNEADTAQQPIPTVKVLLADDHAIRRGGVRSLLEDTEFHVVGEAASGREAVEKTRELNPDLVLLDIRMAGGDGLDALSNIKAESPQVAVVMLTTYDNPTYMARLSGWGFGLFIEGSRSRKVQGVAACGCQW